MECVTWLTHKYLMRFYVVFSEDHHQPKYANIFERNIFLRFCYWVCFFLLEQSGFNYLFFIGLGITAYGFCFHDVLIHQRFKWFKTTKTDIIGLQSTQSTKKMGKEGSEVLGYMFPSSIITCSNKSELKINYFNSVNPYNCAFIIWLSRRFI
jgi:beta-carotene 3-hydroxylase